MSQGKTLRGTLDPVQQAAIDAADASIAVVDAAGQIIGVNRGWLEFGAGNGRPNAAEDIGRPYPLRGHDGVHGVLSGRSKSYSVVYPCHSPTQRRWFRLLLIRVTNREPTRVLVIHRRLADAPTEHCIGAAGEELSRRWHGVQTVCAWCSTRVRDVMGAWRTARPEPDAVYSHGLCPTCLDEVLPAGPERDPRRPQHHALSGQSRGQQRAS